MGITVYPHGQLAIRIVVERPTYTAERIVDVETGETLSQVGEFSPEDLVFVVSAANFASYQFRGFPRGAGSSFGPGRSTLTYRYDAYRPDTPEGQAYYRRKTAALLGVSVDEIALPRPRSKTPAEYQAEVEAFKAKFLADLAKKEAAEDQSAAR